MWVTGHVHRDSVYDGYGCRVESFRAAAKQGHFADSHGYSAPSELRGILLHYEDGEVARYRERVKS